MCSKNSHGESSIVPVLRKGSAVVATRAHMHYVVTEYGIAYLFGKSLRQRAHALIQIAHPDFSRLTFLLSLLFTLHSSLALPFFASSIIHAIA
ncbi:unnamed protein product [Dibothriocephalus latus]|uniref:Acetyl-CoA hydrolase/transferase C-terminal domain-containing protein n=1 Tax=Dibothriocephalus latus TaxID=60516 RepID=A0A3P7RFB5_DIBLA|nr:unnamed protein product [Dibothriocephalus latus]